MTPPTSRHRLHTYMQMRHADQLAGLSCLQQFCYCIGGVMTPPYRTVRALREGEYPLPLDTHNAVTNREYPAA